MTGSSRWCLHELQEVLCEQRAMSCRREREQDTSAKKAEILVTTVPGHQGIAGFR
jgi:hypothetical protein